MAVNYNDIPAMYPSMLKWTYRQWADAGSSVWTAIDQAYTAGKITKAQYQVIYDKYQNILAEEVRRRKREGVEQKVIVKTDSDTLAKVKASARNNAIDEIAPKVGEAYLDGYNDAKWNLFKNVSGMGSGVIGVVMLAVVGLIAFSFIFKK